MNQKKYIALAAAGVIILGCLAAVFWPGKSDAPAQPTPPVTASPALTATPEPTDTPEPTGTLPPAQTASPTGAPEETPRPTEKPAPTPAPTQKPEETPEPSAPPASPEPDTSVVQSVWNEIAKGELPSFSDVDAATLTDLYGIASTDVTEFICKVPMISATIHEFFIARVADGKLDAVKAACETRQKNLAGGFLYPSQTELVSNYKIVTSGNYILFCITDDTDAAVTAFQTFAK